MDKLSDELIRNGAIEHYQSEEERKAFEHGAKWSAVQSVVGIMYLLRNGKIKIHDTSAEVLKELREFSLEEAKNDFQKNQ